jgi:hypothetical protein
LVGTFPESSDAFSLLDHHRSSTDHKKQEPRIEVENGMPTRRNFLQVLPPILLGQSSVLLLSLGNEKKNANAVMADKQEVFQIGKDLTPEQAKERLKEGIKSLDYLLKHYEEICEGGGDNVRRYLGTVGTSSGMYGIIKVMKVLQNEADDIVEYTETMNEVNASINGANGSAYMAIFVNSSSSSTPAEKYFADAKIETKRALKALQDLAQVLDI